VRAGEAEQVLVHLSAPLLLLLLLPEISECKDVLGLLLIDKFVNFLLDITLYQLTIDLFRVRFVLARVALFFFF
jgi:hypothetical protein